MCARDVLFRIIICMPPLVCRCTSLVCWIFISGELVGGGLSYNTELSLRSILKMYLHCVSVICLCSILSYVEDYIIALSSCIRVGKELMFYYFDISCFRIFYYPLFYFLISLGFFAGLYSLLDYMFSR